MAEVQRYRVNGPDVVCEVIGGEAVIVDMHSGIYYSVEGAGADMWECIEQGMPLPQIVSTLTDRYESSEEQISDALDQLVKQLQAAGLIVADSEQPAPRGFPRAPSGPPSAARLQFTVPVLQQYTDMEDLLLLDPIHAADEQ